MILLDTHVWVWLISGNPKLEKSKKLAKILNFGRKSEIKLSPISLWEVAMLESRKRLSFNEPCLQWLKQAMGAPGISLEPISADIAYESSNLPDNFHGDQADRIIVATARIMDFVLYTADGEIQKYGKKGYLKIEAL